MTSSTTHQPVDDVIYLASCAVREISPDPARVRQMDLDQVFHEARRQMLAACCAFALESVDMCTEDFKKAKNRAVRKTVLFDIQRKEVLDRLEEAGIWYMPLKGAVLKDFYPSIGMREMSDNDILFDAARTKDMRDIMADLGFSAKQLDIEAHDVFHKEPIHNFEMHRLLFSSEHDASLRSYYENVQERFIPDESASHVYHFSPEDFYLYMVAHEYKHYVEGGTGPRGCLDTYIFLKHHQIDFVYVQEEAGAMGIADFERTNRSLSIHLVEDCDFSYEERCMLEYMQQSGVYGSLKTSIEHKVGAYGGGTLGRARYLLHRLHIPMERVRSTYPFFYRHKLLLPLVPIVRFGRAITVSRHKVISEIRAISKSLI